MRALTGDAARRVAGAAAEQRGLTVIEAVLAVFVLMIGSLGVLQLTDAGARNTYRATQSQVLINQAEAELERIKQMPYDRVAFTSPPTSSADPNHPAFRVVGGQYSLDRARTAMRPIATSSRGQLDPAPTPFASGDVSGWIHRYVVWVDDPHCGASCPGVQDLKRVIVAVSARDTGSGGVRAYQELQSEVVDPDVTPEDDAAPPEEESEGVPATFWITDTSCKEPERLPMTGDHATHNTLGICDGGTETGGTAGSPDLMFNQQPPLCDTAPDCDTSDLPDVYDYSTDVAGTQGLQMLEPILSSGCTFNPSSLESSRHHKIHRWLSPPVPANESITLRNEATLELWTRASQAGTKGRICVWLFKRTTNAHDTPVANLDRPELDHFTYARDSWPTAWSEISVSMRFLSLNLLPGERLGLAVAVEPQGTSAERLEFMYDHPSFESRLEAQADALLPTFGG